MYINFSNLGILLLNQITGTGGMRQSNKKLRRCFFNGKNKYFYFSESSGNQDTICSTGKKGT